MCMPGCIKFLPYGFHVKISGYVDAFIRTSLSIIVYNVYMEQDFPEKDKTLHPDDPLISSAIVAFSSIIYFLNSLGAYIINLVLLSIPYLW